MAKLALDTLYVTLERLKKQLSEHEQSSLVLDVQITAVNKAINNHPDNQRD